MSILPRVGEMVQIPSGLFYGKQRHWSIEHLSTCEELTLTECTHGSSPQKVDRKFPQVKKCNLFSQTLRKCFWLQEMNKMKWGKRLPLVYKLCTSFFYLVLLDLIPWKPQVCRSRCSVWQPRKCSGVSLPRHLTWFLLCVSSVSTQGKCDSAERK